jgi:hypothetical protein
MDPGLRRAAVTLAQQHSLPRNQPPPQLSVIAMGDLSVEQKPDPLGVAHGADSDEAGHAFQYEAGRPPVPR